MPIQVYFILGLLAAFGILAFALSMQIKKYDAKMAAAKKKKGRTKRMREFKNPGK